MRVELLTVGSELTNGTTLNTNAAYLARRLAEIGLPCQRQVTVGDERATLTDALQEALHRCDVLVTTGGLGPTFDDVTMQAIAEVAQRPLLYLPTVATKIRRFYARSHRRLQRAALRQAYLPQGGGALPNPLGTAPGLWLSLPNQVVIALPGVPGEMRAIMERHVLPRLKRLRGSVIIESRVLRTVGIAELSIEAILRTLPVPEPVTVGLYPHLRMVDIQLTATGTSRWVARRALSRLEANLRSRLGAAVYGTDAETLEGVIGRLLVSQLKTLAVAESCTGGLLSDRITNVPGSSRYLRGSVIAYHNDVKRHCVGVLGATLAQFGAVSAQVAKEMAKGVRRLTAADVGLAVTGVAGPTGGTKKKPVGLVYLGLADHDRSLTQRCQFFGDRAAIKSQAVQTALDWLRRYLLVLRQD
jgi:nicotinamide-nucleotide amidase